MNKVFVYGTLMRGGRLHGYLENSTFISEDEIRGFEKLNLGWYPGIVPRKDKTMIVKGEVYEVTDETLNVLDIVEGTPTLFKRITVQTKENGWVNAYQFVQ
jgi:gamma-glutamylaminecyclotransferase